MTIAESTTIAVEERPIGAIQWGPIVAGALAAAAISFVLHTFAVAVGLSVSSTSPTWRDSSAWLLALSGLYLVLVAIAAFGAGGYLAGRLRSPLAGPIDEIEFRDGVYGVMVWAIALVLSAFIAWAAAQSATRLAAPGGSPSGATQSVAGENIIAFDLDRLFRAERRPQNVDLTYPRAEAARILLTSTGHTGVRPEDRTYLIRLTAANTGLAPPDAERRVDAVIVQARDNIRKARRAGVILAFMAGAAALLGAAVAWFASIAGGEHRDGRRAVPAMWLPRSRRVSP
jgi:hypothetical protein